MISVVIPVGPNPVYLEWLPECIESVRNQTMPPDEIFILYDGFGVKEEDFKERTPYTYLYRSYTWDYDWSENGKVGSRTGGIAYNTFSTPIRLGVADMFNLGVALADNECVFMLGSDDKMMPTCLEECWKTYLANNKKNAWYNVSVITQRGEESWQYNHTSMITKGLFKWFEKGTGYFGFPPSAFVAMDAVLISILMKHAPDKLIQVKQGTPLVWLREHDTQVTHTETRKYAQVVDVIRNIETVNFEVPDV